MFPFISSGVRIFIQIIVWSDDTIWPDLRARHHKNPSLLSQQQIEINTSDWSNADKNRPLIGSQGFHENRHWRSGPHKNLESVNLGL